jgi:hypothetical protein
MTTEVRKLIRKCPVIAFNLRGHRIGACGKLARHRRGSLWVCKVHAKRIDGGA